MCDSKTWELIKAEYIAGGTSYSLLAKKYGTSKAAISRRASAQGWMELAERCRNETETRVAERVSETKVDRFMQLYEMADTAQERIRELMELPIENARDANAMVSALNGTVQLLRDLYGIPSEQQMQGRERLAIMREDLKLRQADQARANGDDAPVQKWVIEMGGDVDE